MIRTEEEQGCKWKQKFAPGTWAIDSSCEFCFWFMVLHSPSVPVLTILLVYHFSILIRYIEVSLLVGMECLIAIQCFIAPSSRWHAFRVWFIFYEMNSCKSTQIEMPVTTITGSALVIQTSTGYKFLFHLTSQRKLPQKKTPSRSNLQNQTTHIKPIHPCRSGWPFSQIGLRYPIDRPASAA